MLWNIGGGEIIEEDCQILEKIKKVEAEVSEDNKSFKLKFEFSGNDFFENKSLEKEYIFDEEKGNEVPQKVKSTEIKWKAGKNITKKIIKKVGSVCGLFRRNNGTRRLASSG